MIIRLIPTPNKLFLQGEGLKEASFDRFHPHTEPDSDRLHFDEQVKASAGSMSVTVRKAMDRLTTGISSWSLETDSDAALELGMKVAEALGIELQL